MPAQKKKDKGQLAIHTENIFPIIKKWLYSEHDIFLRELISNSVDAMSKRKLEQPEVDEKNLKVVVKLDKKDKVVQVQDSGIGMTEEEVKKYINQIAFSSAEDFISRYKDKQANIIGHFGLGFYSSFMVAKKVTIDTLSYKENSEPAFWECDGTTEYQLSKGKRKEPGTTVTIYLNDESDEYLEDYKIRSIIEKYCNFMPFPIEFDGKKVNQLEALWHRNPKDIKESEYKEFYKSLFHDFEDPLFWIHLNVDFPFNLKGILYFPKIKNQLEMNKGIVKLYCNNVFVADNLKEFIPEFLLLLKGGIDVPDIPLNVSRSFLQQDTQVKKISKYIIKKVSDYLNELFTEDRKKYEENWEDLKLFIKYGLITDDSFYDHMKDKIIFKTTKDVYVTIEEYQTRNKSDDKPYKVYYAAGDDTQVTYLNLMKEQGIEVIYSDVLIDNHLFQQLEMKEKDLTFTRVDSELNESLIDKDKKEIVDSENKTSSDKIKEVFDKFINNKNVTVEVKSLKTKAIPGMVVFNEFMRRMQEMSSFMNTKDSKMLDNHTFIVNSENPTVEKILELSKKGKNSEAELLVQYIHSLSLLEQNKFDGSQLKGFIEKANKILDLV